MTGERGGLRADALHQAAIATYHVDVVVEDMEAGPVMPARQPSARDRHADAGGDPLAQRAGGRLDSRYPMIFRVSGRLAVELPETTDVVEGDRGRAETLILRIHGLGF